MRIYLRVMTVGLLTLSVFACGHKDDRGGGNDDPKKPDVEPKEDEGDPDVEPAVPDVKPVNEAIADFRGYRAVDSILRERLIEPGEDARNFGLGTYLQGYNSDNVYGLARLLGFHEGTGIEDGFRNGKANSINMVLWHMALTSLAADLATECTGEAMDRPFQFKEEFALALKGVCAWPAPEARSDAAMRTFFQELGAFDLPEAEVDAFVAFFGGDDYASATAEKAVQDMATAVFLSPYFLIHH